MLINCRVITNAKEVSIIKQQGGFYRIRLNIKPLHGKANKKLIEVLAQYFGVAKSQIAIMRGETSKNKVIKVLRR